MAKQPALVQRLLKPETYPHSPQKVELVQTQMSFLFLTGDYVYKVKKPVDLGYLDYTTLEKRHFFCRQEIELNRRLCPDAYLEVVPIISRQGQISLGGEGEIIEYAVKMRQLPADRMMDKLLPQNLVTEEMVARDMWAAFLLMDMPDNTWWDDVRTKDMIETRDDILVRSFSEAYSNTVTALGKNRNKWRWGYLHTATFVSNPLGQSGIGLIENLVNRGPFPTSGSTDTVNNTVWFTNSGNFEVKWVPSMRMIVDLGDFSNSVTIHTTGQSGHPYSKHYDDMIDLWRNIKYQPMLWTREQVEKAAVDRLILNPDK